MGLVLSAILTGLFTGMIARLALPGPDPMPIWLTTTIGLVGTVVGGGIAVGIVGRDPSWVMVGGLIASIVIIALYRHFVQRRPIWGKDAYRFPERGVGVPEYRERLQRAGIDPDSLGSPFQPPVAAQPVATPPRAAAGDDPTENPAHYLGLIEELHDHGVLDDEEYETVRRRLLERLRS